MADTSVVNAGSNVQQLLVGVVVHQFLERAEYGAEWGVGGESDVGHGGGRGEEEGEKLCGVADDLVDIDLFCDEAEVGREDDNCVRRDGIGGGGGGRRGGR